MMMSRRQNEQSINRPLYSSSAGGVTVRVKPLMLMAFYDDRGDHDNENDMTLYNFKFAHLLQT